MCVGIDDQTVLNRHYGKVLESPNRHTMRVAFADRWGEPMISKVKPPPSLRLDRSQLKVHHGMAAAIVHRKRFGRPLTVSHPWQAVVTSRRELCRKRQWWYDVDSKFYSTSLKIPPIELTSNKDICSIENKDATSPPNPSRNMPSGSLAFGRMA